MGGICRENDRAAIKWGCSTQSQMTASLPKLLERDEVLTLVKRLSSGNDRLACASATPS